MLLINDQTSRSNLFEKKNGWKITKCLNYYFFILKFHFLFSFKHMYSIIDALAGKGIKKIINQQGYYPYIKITS